MGNNSTQFNCFAVRRMHALYWYMPVVYCHCYCCTSNPLAIPLPLYPTAVPYRCTHPGRCRKSASQAPTKLYNKTE